ncbi:MAG TPA: glycerol-3-phosphate 1-O-acyltransferase PlsY [Steroidobacteraceae bacterium]|nr:glycerol-3-phosphate 1-O-acyltransferase PlsY [Steroidobacteraceae bacterium]
MSELLIKAALAYLLGSIVGSLLIRRLTGGADIRLLGSGNAGATNALRTLGIKVAFWVLLIDMGKGWIATARLAPWALPGMAAPSGLAAWCVPVCGVAVMLGHVYPLWYGFRGGKGVATLVGAVLGISPWLLLPMILTWLAAVVLFGYVSLGSILGAVAVVVWIALRHPTAPLLTFALLAALLVVFTHRANIARLRAGTESRARRLWLLGARRGAA